MIAVISTLAALVAPNVIRHVGRAKHTAARSQIEMLATAIESYRMDMGRYPSSSEGLRVLRELPAAELDRTRWLGPYLMREVPTDPWGVTYHYRAPGQENPGSYDLWSHGADAAEGGEGDDADVTNW